ncbi:hypothetical protein BJF81_08480 [Ornithinimicrobium sp. CNJ-824]|uniref:hypothetical protein n=1 Tax=Ornithinimicrobium sp. CNJ-824 TaxID=1904966 RepID=UPI000969901E|nr:hypothetical protein [Ornithinimicrobium sp. CNJ-824]OLT19547.1 hypothetical protein BJF81_08480 [Ornithinimicrobium sp. CNJ-824]
MQQRLARWARSAPGYRWALTEVLPRVRSSATLSDLAWRVFAPRHTAGHVDVPLHGGVHLTGPDVSRVPVVGVVALGLDDETLAALMERVARLQRQLASFRPVFVVDRPVFAAARPHGYVLDLVVPRVEWLGEEGDYLLHVASRVAALRDHYQVWHVILADGPDLDPLDEALLTHLVRRLPADLDVRVATVDGSAE